MSKKITIKDVAKEAGVSIGTVDRVLHKRGRYSETTAKAVQQAIKKLNYKPSEIASALVTMRKHLKIGVSYPLDEAFELFWDDVRKGVQRAASELSAFGIEIIEDCPNSFSFDAQQSALKRLVSQDVNAIITTALNPNNIEDRFSHYIPQHIPFATAINRDWDNEQLFHIGPNDEATGSLIARLIQLYCGNQAKVLMIAPNMEVEGTQKRIQGFVNKLATELVNIKLLQISPIIAQTIQQSYTNIHAETKRILEQYPDLNAIYVTNGFVKPCADAVREAHSKVKVFGHEYFLSEDEYLNDGTIAATVCQNSGEQWYQAIMEMVAYLNGKNTPAKFIPAKCSIIMKETLPLLSNQFE